MGVYENLLKKKLITENEDGSVTTNNDRAVSKYKSADWQKDVQSNTDVDKVVNNLNSGNLWEQVQNIARPMVINNAKSIANLVGLGLSKGIKQVPYYIDNANEQNFLNYKDLRRQQFLTNPNVNPLEKAQVKEQNDLLLQSKGIVPNYNRQDEKKLTKDNWEDSVKMIATSQGKEIPKIDKTNNIEIRQKPNEIETNLVKKYWKDSIVEDEKKIQEEQSKLTDPIAKKLGEVAPSMGQMLPGTVLSAVNPVLGTGYFYTSAGGSYMQDGLDRGMTEKEAWNYANIMAALESASETVITGQQLNKISNAFGGKQISKTVLDSYGFNMLENAAQEAVMEPAQELTAQLVAGNDKANWDGMMERMGTSAFNGALMGVISNGATYGLEKTGVAYNKIKNGETLTEKEINEVIKENIDRFGKENVEKTFKEGADKVYQQIQPITMQNSEQNTQSQQVTLPTQENSLNQNVVANNKQTLYNNSNRMESDINEQIQSRGMAGISEKFDTRVQQEGKQQQSRQFTRQEYEQWENNITPTEESKLNDEQRKLRNNIKRQYNKDIVFFDGENDYNAGSSLIDRNKIYVNLKEAETFGINKVVLHEIAESNILHNKGISSDIIQPVIEKIINDSSFEKQKQEFWRNQNENMPSDYAIAKDILCDRFAEIQSGEKLDYNNLLSKETNMTIDYALSEFNNKIQKVNLPIMENNTQNTKGEEINWNEVEKPEGKIRKHYRSIIESSNTTAEAKAIAKEMMGTDTYVPESNKNLIQKADNRIKSTNPNTELSSLYSRVMNNEKITDVDIAVGERLIEYYSKIGDKEHLQDAIHTTALAGTQAGRTVQAFALLNHMTPQGQVVWLQRSIEKANAELQQKYKNKSNVPQFELTQDMADKVLNTKSKEEMFRTLDEVYEELGQQVPKSISEKIDEWRYFSMLANIKTHGRNIIGNVAMHFTQRVKDKVAGAIEDTVAKFNPNMERTHTLRGASDNVKQFAKNDLNNIDVQTQLGMNENKYNPQSRIQNARRTFKSDLLEKTLGKLFDINSNALEVEDNIGLKSMYVKALSDYITANKIDVNNITDAQLQKARQHAVKSAQEATFHQASALATALNQMGKKNNITKFALDSAVPFKKTPINVAKTGAQYSPVGLIKSAVYDSIQLRKGNITINQYIDNISKGLTGTGIAYMGYVLAEAGILKASGDDDDKKEKYDEEQGKQTYSIEIGGKTYSLDWLSPVGIPLFIGAEINEQFNQTKKEKNSVSSDDEDTMNKIIKSVSNIANASANAINPMSEMSMVSGLTNVLTSYNKENAVGDMIVNAGKSYVNQFVPTALGQLARTTDDYERSTKSTKTGTVEKAIDSTINQFKNKIPGLRQTLPTKTDIWGNDIKQETKLPMKIFNNFVNPSTVKNVSTDKVDKEINNLYAKTGESSIIPKTLEKTMKINETNYRLTNEEYSKYTQKFGETAHTLLNNLIDSKEYKSLNNEQKKNIIEDVYSYAKELNKIDYANKVGEKIEQSTLYEAMQSLKKDEQIEYLSFKSKLNQEELTVPSVKDYQEIKNSGIKLENYIDYRKKVKDETNKQKNEGTIKENGKLNDKDKIQILLDSNYSDQERQSIYENYIKEQNNEADVYDALMKNGLNINQYLKYKQQDFISDKIDDGTVTGKTVSSKDAGSKKNKMFSYINENIDGYANQLLILGTQYKLDKEERDIIEETIYNLDMSNEEKLKILGKMKGFTVYKDGNVKW